MSSVRDTARSVCMVNVGMLGAAYLTVNKHVCLQRSASFNEMLQQHLASAACSAGLTV